MHTYAYGFPRLGNDREYKTIIEGFWNGSIEEAQLQEMLQELEQERLAIYERHVDTFPVGEMTLYDSMLDTAMIVGVYKKTAPRDYYTLCRGDHALKLTKWFNTNYHYLVPEFREDFRPQDFVLAWNKPGIELQRHKKGAPSLIGPFTFLKLSRLPAAHTFREYFLALIGIYAQMTGDFQQVHVEEPAFALDLSPEEVDLIKEGYGKLCARNCNINLFTYYDSVDFLKDLYDLPVAAIGLDFVNGNENYARIKKYGFPRDKILIAGVVDGRNIWRTNIVSTVGFLKELSGFAKTIAVSNAGPLYHLPITTAGEKIDSRLLSHIAFAQQRLEELRVIAQAYDGGNKAPEAWSESAIGFGEDPSVQERIRNLKAGDFVKAVPYPERAKEQQRILGLPPFPVTTIGSFPQTRQVRQKRGLFRAGKLSKEDYTFFIREEITRVVKMQEELGIDVLVHGEFERTDMVEFFAQKLNGIATTTQGWIISYGTRVYRPPVIYGDVSRPEPMTCDEIVFAQSLTTKPVKGMLTGPVTITAWSFVRRDIPVHEVAYQIALCIQDEIRDYEKAGIAIAQIDEPAFKEKAPLKKRRHNEYFDWAVKSFNLASQSQPATQIHTHMCYSEFRDVIQHILAMEFDVISIEASRSRGEVIEAFRGIDFGRQIGVGVWDIHSPAIPTTDAMQEIVDRVLKILPRGSLWINPDCGLKTRGWEETASALKNLVKLADRLRRTNKVEGESHVRTQKSA